MVREDKPCDSSRIVCHWRRRSLPVVLTRDEVAQVVRESGSLRNRTAVMTLYSTLQTTMVYLKVSPEALGRSPAHSIIWRSSAGKSNCR